MFLMQFINRIIPYSSERQTDPRPLLGCLQTLFGYVKACEKSVSMLRVIETALAEPVGTVWDILWRFLMIYSDLESVTNLTASLCIHIMNVVGQIIVNY